MVDCLSVGQSVPSLTGVYLICVSAESQFSFATLSLERNFTLLFENKRKDRGSVIRQTSKSNEEFDKQ